jgi:HK97 family phage major capsid protein
MTATKTVLNHLIESRDTTPDRYLKDRIAKQISKLLTDSSGDDFTGLRNLEPGGKGVDLLVNVRMVTEARDLTAGISAAGGATVAKSFSSAIVGAIVADSPLLQVATVITTDNASPIEAGASVTPMQSVGAPPIRVAAAIQTVPSIAGLTAEGAAMGGTDPAFKGLDMGSFKYGELINVTLELAEDTAMDLEALMVERVSPALAYRFNADCWTGAGGTTAPEGLLAALSTVTGGIAATPSLIDVEGLIAAVPSQYTNPDKCTIIVSPGAYQKLRAERDLNGAYRWPASAGRNLFGYKVLIDSTLPAPGTGARSIVVGDFSSAYAIRLAPLRVDQGEIFNTAMRRWRIVLRADGKTLATDAARALVGP